jgi:uncharacterized protein (TIGR03118 family)
LNYAQPEMSPIVPNTSSFSVMEECMQSYQLTSRVSAWIFIVVLALTGGATAQKYQQTNLDSDIVGLASNPPAGQPDKPLLNPWGIAAGPGSPLWVADNNGGVSTLYNGAGVLQGLVVNIPPTVNGKGTGTPTGIVFAGGRGFTVHGNGATAAAAFIFVTEDGTVVGWAPTLGPDLPNDAFITVPNQSGNAVYKGCTIAKVSPNGPSYLYVTNFRSGQIEAYDTNFKLVTLDAGGGDDRRAFHDEEIPSDFAPFNVQAVNGDLYVTYAKQNSTKHDDFDAPGLGFVDKFSPTGKLLQRLQSGPWLDAPWGVALAPANFGFFGNHLLIGNAGSGQIAVYDPASGRFDGLLRDQNGHALQNQRLWGLQFSDGTGAQASAPTNTLFFTAGVNDEADGLFGTITPADTAAPENNRDDN